MNTFVLMRFEHTDEPLSWWRRLLGQKYATNWLQWRDMRHVMLCSVRAKDFAGAAALLGGCTHTMGFSPSPFLAENAKYKLFKAGPDTFKIIVRTYDLLGRPEDVRDPEAFENHTRLHVQAPLTMPFRELFRNAQESRIMYLERSITHALTDMNNGRAALFLAQVPEVRPAGRATVTAQFN